MQILDDDPLYLHMRKYTRKRVRAYGKFNLNENTHCSVNCTTRRIHVVRDIYRYIYMELKNRFFVVFKHFYMNYFLR